MNKINFFKKFFVFLLSFFFSLNVLAIELDDATRTVALDGSGNGVILTPEQVKRGKRLFNASCGSCHTGGITKTNPNIGLDPEALSLATPNRNSIAGLVDYLKTPTSYDGLESIAEVHPSIASADIFPKMRSLSEEDLFAIAGHILVQPQIVSEKWGGGKIYY
jgi:photosystem II cytochrome c550|mmetsp:Transcript_69555/g.119468  ORF Transcript_69555/g.119468 Transcript_69555/m.119468 type:complete len:163 (+) Transcript_69555:869-1357(+)